MAASVTAEEGIVLVRIRKGGIALMLKNRKDESRYTLATGGRELRDELRLFLDLKGTKWIETMRLKAPQLTWRAGHTCASIIQWDAKKNSLHSGLKEKREGPKN